MDDNDGSSSDDGGEEGGEGGEGGGGGGDETPLAVWLRENELEEAADVIEEYGPFTLEQLQARALPPLAPLPLLLPPPLPLPPLRRRLRPSGGASWPPRVWIRGGPCSASAPGRRSP